VADKHAHFRMITWITISTDHYLLDYSEFKKGYEPIGMRSLQDYEEKKSKVFITILIDRSVCK